MSPAPLIQVRDLVRRDAKGERLLLDHASLTIDVGDRVGLIGPTGSGKSSLLRAIGKLDPIESGEILFEGRDVSRNEIPPYRRQVIYLAQRPSLLAGSVKSNIEMPFELKANSGRYDPSLMQDWLGRLGQSEQLLAQNTEKLSGGEQQLVALLRAISLSPQVLLLDEPTASLDGESTDRFERLVDAWQKGDDGGASRALVWTSHDTDQVERMTDRIVEMSGGKLRARDGHG